MHKESEGGRKGEVCLQRKEGAQPCTPQCVFGTISSTSPCLAFQPGWNRSVAEEMALKTHISDLLFLRSLLVLYWSNDAETHQGLLQTPCLCAFRTMVRC